MSKILVVGDVHNKPHILYQALTVADEHEVDKIIFIGDYFDDFNDTVDDVLETALSLNEVMKDPRVIALIGNHELSYIEDQRCSGWSEGKRHVIESTLHKYKLSLSYQEGNWLFTHAGLTRKWMKYAERLNITMHNKLDPEYVMKESNETYADWLNRFWEKYPGIYKSMGRERGGYGIGSPLWADIEELVRDNLPGINQVVGHTPMDEVTGFQKGKDKIIAIDVWSNGGPGGFLLWEDGEIRQLDSTGSLHSQATSA